MSPAHARQVRTMWLSGAFSDRAIGEAVGSSRNNVCRMAKRWGWERSPEAVLVARARIFRARVASGKRVAKHLIPGWKGDRERKPAIRPGLAEPAA